MLPPGSSLIMKSGYFGVSLGQIEVSRFPAPGGAKPKVRRSHPISALSWSDVGQVICRECHGTGVSPKANQNANRE